MARQNEVVVLLVPSHRVAMEVCLCLMARQNEVIVLWVLSQRGVAGQQFTDGTNGHREAVQRHDEVG